MSEKKTASQILAESWISNLLGAVGDGTLRTSPTGATRDTATGKIEPWGFTSALVERRFSEYMDEHRVQSDGSVRDSDNWKKGLLTEWYKHSLSRHILDLKLHLEGFPEEAVELDYETVLCAVLFNVQGLLHNHLAGIGGDL